MNRKQPRCGALGPGETEVFSLRTASALRRAIQKALEVPVQPGDDASDPWKRGWSRADPDEKRLRASVPTLRLRPGFRLVGYLFRAGGNGNGVIWAVDREPPSLDATPRQEGVFLDPPRPPGSRPVADVLAGDGSPRSYLTASLLFRELSEYGAAWHGINWGTHQLIGGPDVRKRDPESRTRPEMWEWQAPAPDEWRPTCSTLADGGLEVRFHTWSGLGREHLCAHVDRYRPPSYSAERESLVLAEGDGGFVF